MGSSALVETGSNARQRGMVAHAPNEADQYKGVIMPTITNVAKAQRDAGNCIRCGQTILKGEPYSRFALYRGPKRMIHSRCGSFTRSELTANDKLSELYAIVDDNPDFSECESTEDARSIAEDYASRIREVAEMYTESAQNIEDGFGHETQQSEEMTEHADEVESFADDVESCINEPDDDEPEDTEDKEEWLETARQQWSDELTSALADCPL